MFEQEQLEDDQRTDEGNKSCKVLPGEGNEVSSFVCVSVYYTYAYIYTHTHTHTHTVTSASSSRLHL